MRHLLFFFTTRLWISCVLTLTLLSCLAFGQTPWVSSDRVGNDARFLYGNQVRSYNLSANTWKTPVTLPRSGATAMAGDSQGQFIAYGTSIYRYGVSFTGETLVATVSGTVQSLFLDGNLLIAVHSQDLYGRVSVFNRTSGVRLSTAETYVESLYGAAHAPGTNRLYGRTQGISPSDIVTASYTDAGVVGNSVDSPSHGDYPNATKTWVFPDETRVVDSSGTVYTAPGLNYFGSFAGSLTDIAFRGDVPIVLRGGDVIAFTSKLLETGRASLGVATGAKIYLTDTAALVFSPATGDPAISTVPFSQISAPEPGAAVEPQGLAYTVDQIFPDKDGNVLLFSKAQMSLFRWSPTERKYTGSFPLLGVPKYAAYSKENNAAYFAYETQVLRKMDLSVASPKEVAFANLPTEPNGLASAGNFVLASDTAGAWGTHYIYSAAGVLTHSLDWNYYSRVWEWDSVKRRMYFFRDDTSPNDLQFETIDTSGKITEDGETPYHGDFTVTPPIRVSPDGTKVVIGSGVVFETSGLTIAGNLANGFSDAVWSAGKLTTLRLINGVSQLQTWEGNQFLPGPVVRQFNGTPIGLQATSGGLLVVTAVEGTPRFTLLNASLETLYVSPTRPVSPGSLAVAGRTQNSVSLQWQDLADNEDGYRVEFRTGAGAWATGASVGAGSTTATVSGLANATAYDFRVVATNGALVSAPSGVVSATTLSSSSQPVGEPYLLKITRIFNNRITLEWQDNALNETAFQIYRSTSSSTLGTPLTAAANTTSYTDTGLAAYTSYYYRIQAVNGGVSAELSTQVSASTLGAASAPSSPYSLSALPESAYSVAISWTDNSTNEDEFIIERSTSPVGVWSEVGRTGFNKTTFKDNSVAPNTAYTYRVKSSNTVGTNASYSTVATTPKLGGEFTGLSMRGGDIHYFAFSGPNRIERYDLVSRSWLAPVPLEAAATALWVDESGIFAAEGRAVVRFNLSGGSRTPIANGQSSVTGLFTVGNTLVFKTGSYSDGGYTSADKLTGIILTTFGYSYDSTGGYSVQPGSRKVYFRSSYYIHSLEIGADGKLVKSQQGSYNGNYTSGTRTFLFPNGARFADDSGAVYGTDSLTYNNSLGAAFTDLSFSGADVPIVLRSNKLVAYSNTLLEAGSFTLGSAGLRVSVSGTDAVVFSADGASTRGLSVQAVPLSLLSAPVPGTAINPQGLAYTPDDVFLDKDGNLLLFSKSQLSLFRWSTTGKNYLPTLPLLGAPAFAGYSKEDHRAYFAYDSQVVRKMDLADANPVETPLFNLPSAPRGFTLAGEFPYVAVGSGLMTFSPTGQNLTTTGFTYYYGNHNTWDAVNRRVYHFRDGTSPDDLHFDTISAAGLITDGGETPYHGDYTMTKPIRVSPDGSKVVIGSGIVFDATGLTKVASLANGFTDAAWFAGKLVSVRLINGVTQLQTWSGPQFVAGDVVRQMSGTPLRLLALDSSRLLLITLVDGVPRFSILNDALEPTYISPSTPLAPSGLAVTNRTTNSIALKWTDGSDNESAFRIEYRPASGTWTQGSLAAVNATSATVSGLAVGTTFEFRVSAVLGDLVSTPSIPVSATTLSSADQPLGEPYNLKVTRIFNNSITLEWLDNADNETGFRILRSTTASGATTEFTVPANSKSFVNTGLVANTSYYFRIQAMNVGVGGDLSAQVSALTLSSNSTPSAPSSLASTATVATSVSLSWKDNSSNEDGFVIERSGSPASTWLALGTLPFNTTAFTDSTAVPNTPYTYRVKAVNAVGSSSYSTTTVTTLKLGGDFAGYSIRAGDVYYFAFSGPNRIERYNLATNQWLAAIPLNAAATALWADESGIFAAEDRAVIRFALDGTGRTPVGNAEATVKSLFTINDVLAFGTSSGDLITMNKRTGLFLANVSYFYSGAGYSAAPALNRVYFRSTNVSPSDIHYLQIGADGKLVKGTDSPYHGDYPSASRTFVFPNGGRVADDSGTVYSTDSLSYTNSLGVAFTDLSFYGVDIPIVLRGNVLQSYNNALLESGRITLSGTGLRVAVSGSDAVVFFADGTDSRGLKIQRVPLADLAAPTPGGPVNPRGLAYTPENVFLDRDGNLLLFSKSQLSLFSWSPSAKRYQASIPLLGSPKYAAYSRENHSAYFAYDSQVVRKLDLSSSSPVETPLLTLSSNPLGLANAGGLIFANDNSGAWTTHYLYSPEGALLDAVDWNYYSTVWEWDAKKRRMYFFRDDTSPNDLQYETISTAGKITDEGETPYHGDFTVAAPIRVNTTGSHVAIGAGSIFETAGMTRVATLPNTFTDALWTNSELLTIRASGTKTQIQRWNAITFASVGTVPLYEGTPIRLMALNTNQMVLITLSRSMPRFYLLNPDLTVAFDYQSDMEDPPPAQEDVPYVWTPVVAWTGLGNGPYTVTAPVLPAWLKFTNGTLRGTPLEADSGDRLNPSKNHRVVLRAVDGNGAAVEKEFTITVNWQNDPPSFPVASGPIIASESASDSEVDLAALMTDPDSNDFHQWALTENSNPSIFSSIWLDQKGRLRISYAPFVSGSSTITVQVTDASGVAADATFSVILPNPLEPVVEIHPEIVLNRATGLYEQKATVRNVSSRAIAGFELIVTGLRAGVRLQNGTMVKDGGGVYSYSQAIQPGKSVTVVLEYFASKRGVIPQPTVGAKVKSPLANASLKTTAGSLQAFAISSCLKNPDLSMSLEFPAEPGVRYRVHYSSDVEHWKSCPEILTSAGTRIQWIDRGAPSTECAPASAKARFYRIERLDP